MEIAVFGVPDRYYGEVVAAAVQLSEPTPAGTLRAFCHGKIAGFKHPAKLFQVSEWPMTSSGKIKKRDLQAAVGAGTPRSSHETAALSPFAPCAYHNTSSR